MNARKMKLYTIDKSESPEIHKKMLNTSFCSFFGINYHNAKNKDLILIFLCDKFVF